MLHKKISLYFIINIICSANCKPMAFLSIQSNVLYSTHYHHSILGFIQDTAYTGFCPFLL